jgi:hypothetical protein
MEYIKDTGKNLLNESLGLDNKRLENFKKKK